jgi:hypothetical protein
MDKFTFRDVVEIAVFLVLYFSIDSLIMKLVKTRISLGTRRFIYLIGLVITFFIFTAIAGLFHYDVHFMNGH